MSFRPSKKRAMEDAAAAAASSVPPPPMSRLTPNSTRTTTTMATTTTKTPEAGYSSLGVVAVLARNPSTANTSSSFPLLCLQHQVESLHAELEHERSLHALDQKRADQARLRLEKQLAIAVEEAQEATQTLQDFTRESHKMTEQLRQARNKTLDELRACQMQLLSSAQGGDEDDSGMVKFWEEKCSYLEDELANHQEDEQQLRLEMQEIQRDIEEKIQAQRAENKQAAAESKVAGNNNNNKIMEEAPLAVLTELNSVRLELADTKRHERQARRRVEDLQQRNTSLIQEREQALLASQRLPVVEQEVTRLRREYEIMAAQNGAWKVFEQELETTLQTMQSSSSGVTTSSSSSGSATSSSTNTPAARARKKSSAGPPEVSAIERYLREAKNRVADMERQKKTLQDECQQLRQANLPLQKEVQELQHKEREWSRDRRQMQAQLEASRRNLQQAEAQQAIYQRETLELQSLIKTCDNLPFTGTTTAAPASTTLSTPDSIKTLELTLSTKRQELDLALHEKDRLSKEKGELSQELETVKEKFGKLRDALLAERNKAQEAEQRANAAEALAGKGSFDPETTRVLHLSETPLAKTLKEEIQVLQRQLEVANAAAINNNKGSNKSLVGNSSASKISVDAEKLNKRLKENFKEQIALFREGVYLMTGFKVDMLPGTERPTFRVRSVYAEKEEDHLLLKWPKTSSSSGGDSVKSLDLLHTDFANNLTSTSSYEYMTKFSSLPAFLAAVQLNLFEKQTVMIS